MRCTRAGRQGLMPPVCLQLLSGTGLEGICQKKRRKSEIFCLSFLCHSKFSLMLVEGRHQTEKSLQLINCCGGVIGSLAIQLLNCLQGLGWNAKDFTLFSSLSFGKEQLQSGAGGWFSPCCESIRGTPASILSPSAPSASCPWVRSASSAPLTLGARLTPVWVKHGALRSIYSSSSNPFCGPHSGFHWAMNPAAVGLIS